MMIIASLSFGFASGWLVSEVRNAEKISPIDIWANDWKSDIALLTRNAHNPQLITPDKVVLLIRSDLNSKSIVLSRVYDHLSPSMKQSMLSYIPSARAIANAQTSSASEQSSKDLLTFVNCMEKVKLKGGLVGNCVVESKGVVQ